MYYLADVYRVHEKNLQKTVFNIHQRMKLVFFYLRIIIFFPEERGYGSHNMYMSLIIKPVRLYIINCTKSKQIRKKKSILLEGLSDMWIYIPSVRSLTHRTIKLNYKLLKNMSLFVHSNTMIYVKGDIWQIEFQAI